MDEREDTVEDHLDQVDERTGPMGIRRIGIDARESGEEGSIRQSNEEREKGKGRTEEVMAERRREGRKIRTDLMKLAS